MTRLIAALFAALLMSALFASRTTHAKEIPPGNFVYQQLCPAPFAQPSVGFAIPGKQEAALLGGDGVRQVWVDLTLFNNNFAPRTFLGAGPFEPRAFGATGFLWPGLEQARTHYYRLNALTVEGRWIELGRGTFETIDCGVVERMECQIGHPDALLGVQFGIAAAFSPPESPALQQWFDLTLHANPRNRLLDNGFPPGSFIGAGPFPPEGTHFWWSGIRPGLRHFYRLNTLYGGAMAGWQQQYSGSFVSLDCARLPAFAPPG